MLSLASCAPAPLTSTPSPLMRATEGALALSGYNEAQTREAHETEAARLALTDSFMATRTVFEFQSTQDAYELEQAARITHATETRAAEVANAVATQRAQATQSAATVTAIPTAIARTATALARVDAIESAEVEAAQSRATLANSLKVYAGALSFIVMILLASLGLAEFRRRIVYAENYKPQVLGGFLVYPVRGGFTHRRIDDTPALAASSSTPELAAPRQDVIERFIPRSGVGQRDGDTLSLVTPVDTKVLDWIDALATALMAFEARGAISESGKPSLKGAGMCGVAKPFRSNDDWVAITDTLAANGLALKTNGDETTLVGDYRSAIARVRDGSRPLVLPASAPPRVRYAMVPKLVESL